MQTPFLLPAPQRLNLGEGVCSLAGTKLILLGNPPQKLYESGLRLQAALQRQGLALELTASSYASSTDAKVTLQVSSGAATPAQGYCLEVSESGIQVCGNDEAGVFYGVCTLVQLLEQYGAEVPCLQIIDWPDFPVRGIMLDISRDKVPTQETLLGLVDMFASWKINQLQLYTEHTFAYHQHPEVWSQASPLTGQEILALDKYCRERFIDLVPNQNSFGHMARWLKHPRYNPLAEINGPFESPWGPMVGPWGLCPSDPGSIELVQGLFDELLPHFTSRMVNVGCDETVDLGHGRSQAECKQYGAGQVYLDYLLKIYRDLKSRGRTMQFWDDIIIKYPEFIPALPKDAIALEWGYEGKHDFAGHCQKLAEAGIPFYVCPGTSSWNSLAGRSDNALKNLLSAAESGLKYGAIGYLNTDWGDNGHCQMLPVSFLGFAAGAAYSWGLEANRSLDIAHALSVYAFYDKSDSLGCVVLELGNIYHAAGIEPDNASSFFHSLFWSLEKIRSSEFTSQIPYRQVLEQIDLAALPLAYAHIKSNGSPICQEEVLLKELDFTARMLRHACWRGLLALGETAICLNENNPPKDDLDFRQKLAWDMQGLMQDYQELWLYRNRPGGLVDSLAHFQKAYLDYAIPGETLIPA